ncbi:hypothetical protein X975_20815, partial [Stegodyphus mimosarum]
MSSISSVLGIVTFSPVSNFLIVFIVAVLSAMCFFIFFSSLFIIKHIRLIFVSIKFHLPLFFLSIYFFPLFSMSWNLGCLCTVTAFWWEVQIIKMYQHLPQLHFEI